jgi:hypothetical protein
MAAFHRNGRKKESENYYTFTTPRQFCVLGEGLKHECGEGEIRTPSTGFGPYNGLANLLAFLTGSENCGLYYIPQSLTTTRF